MAVEPDEEGKFTLHLTDEALQVWCRGASGSRGEEEDEVEASPGGSGRGGSTRRLEAMRFTPVNRTAGGGPMSMCPICGVCGFSGKVGITFHMKTHRSDHSWIDGQ